MTASYNYEYEEREMKNMNILHAMSAIVAELFTPSKEYSRVKTHWYGGRRFNTTNRRKPHQSAREKMRRVAQGKAGTMYKHGGQYTGNDKRSMQVEFNSSRQLKFNP